jgi:hypothetical protein
MSDKIQHLAFPVSRAPTNVPNLFFYPTYSNSRQRMEQPGGNYECWYIRQLATMNKTIYP